MSVRLFVLRISVFGEQRLTVNIETDTWYNNEIEIKVKVGVGLKN